MISEKKFDLATWIQNNPSFSVEAVPGKYTFREISQWLRQHLDQYFDDEKDTKKRNERLEKQHEAIIGVESAKNYFLAIIREFLMDHNITHADFPYGESLEDALFQDVFGWGPLTPFFEKDIETAIVYGTEIWFEIDGYPQRQKMGFESIERVQELITALTMRDPTSKINQQNPELELEMEDGTRVAMVIPRRSREIIIEFRKFIIKNFTLDKHASLGTIDPNDIPFFNSLARLHLNTVFAGKVKSAKTTMLKTFYALRDARYVAAVTEQHFELNLKRDFPDRLVIELQANEDQLEQVIRRVLRFYHDFILVPEVRSIEAEAAMMSCEKGVRGMMMSYHNTYVQNIPVELARFILNEYPNRQLENEVIRVGKNLDIVITMDAMKDRSKKKVTSVSEIYYDPEKQKVYSHLIMKWDAEKNVWRYHNGFSDRMKRYMAEFDEHETRNCLSFLEAAAKERPIENETLTHVCW